MSCQNTSLTFLVLSIVYMILEWKLGRTKYKSVLDLILVAFILVSAFVLTKFRRK